MADKIIEEIKKGLTGESKKDIVYLQDQAIKYMDHPKSSEILRILSDMAFSLLPEESQKQFKEAMVIGNKRLDQVYNDILKAIKAKDFDTAENLLSEIEKKADTYFTLENGFSFRNRIDEHLYAHMYKPEKRYMRTPYDFCQYFSTYGYLLIEQHKPKAAIEKLEKAIKFNPVNIEPRFELCEAYKVLHEPENLLEAIKESIKLCITPYHISRCYANLGFYCIEIKDYDSAAVFCFESLIYVDNPSVKGELQHIRALTGKDIEPPKKEAVLAVFEKYGIKNGPDPDIVNLIYSLGCYCMDHNAPPQESLAYMQIVYDLTHSEKVQDTIDMLKAQIAAHNARGK